MGTVQFGTLYGIVNDSGCPSDEEIIRILTIARQAGIRYLDTAHAYGNAEQRLGALAIPNGDWGLITKIAPLDSFMRSTGIDDPSSAAATSVRQSLQALNVSFLDIIMLHRAADTNRTSVLNALEAEVEAGRIGEIGVSVYSPADAIKCLEDKRIRHVQIPFNLLDGRWLQKEFTQALETRPDAKIHARSSFLQGLLLSPPSRWPSWVANAKQIAQALDRLVDRTGCKSRMELCLRYSASMPWIATTVVGVDSASHLADIAAASVGKPFSEAELSQIWNLSTFATPRLIDPSTW